MSQDTSIVLTATTRPGDVVRISAPTGEAADTIRALLAEHPAILDVTCHADVTASAAATAYRPKYGSNAGTRWRRRPGVAPQRDRMADEVRAAADELFREVDELHYAHGWPYAVEFEERAFRAVGQARMLLSRDRDMTVDAMLKALKPVMDAWWAGSPLIARARAAVDRLRHAAAVTQYAHARPGGNGEARPERRAA